MGLALLWALLLGVPGAPDPWSDDVGLPGYDLSFIPWNDEEPQFRERAVKVYHLSPDLGRLDGGLLVNVTGKGFIAQAATDPKCQFGAPENCVDESCIENHVVPATVVSPTLLQCISPVNEDRSFSGQEVSLEVTLNGVDWTQSRRPFLYYGARPRAPRPRRRAAAAAY